MNLQKSAIRSSLCLVFAACWLAPGSFADDQTKVGAGNTAAIALAKKSPMVQSAYQFVLSQAGRLRDFKLRRETLDALGNDNTCIRHRANLSEAQKDAIVQALLAQNLANPADAAAIVGGLKAGVFPPVVEDGTGCPKLPQKFFSAPGSASVFGHHSYPGGLPVHESNNDIADVHLAKEYREVYGNTGRGGLPTVNPSDVQGESNQGEDSDVSAIFIDEDLIIGAPLWHDWAKPMVFQWNANGTEFVELNFGGTGANDN